MVKDHAHVLRAIGEKLIQILREAAAVRALEVGEHSEGHRRFVRTADRRRARRQAVEQGGVLGALFRRQIDRRVQDVGTQETGIRGEVESQVPGADLTRTPKG